MPVFAVAAALGASCCWAAGALLAHRPATLLGPFALTRIQLGWSAALLIVVVSLLGRWQSVVWSEWFAFVVASVVGVVAANIAMFACMRRGGPRRAQLLVSMNGPIAALLGFVFLGEVISGQKLAGCAIALSGMALAILYGGNREDRLEDVRGPMAIMVGLGLLAAASNAVGLVFLKPAMLAGTDPLAANALRTAGGTLVIAIMALWNAPMFAVPEKPGLGLTLHAIAPGVLGHVVAVSLLLYAVRWMDTGIAVVLGSAAPVIMLPMIWALTRKRPRMLAWLGAFLAVAGTSLILI
ncbi:DMT family transporter [Hoeflea sp.]|uniref:DMT family transporter n=1 Tax=Hoeflea sp. TaxID=1940281 RepID=UPI003B015213